MRRFLAIVRWDLMLGLRNRFMQVFAVACVLGGLALLIAAPGREALPLVLIQVLLFFGSLFAFLLGWGSGQQARHQGAFLFAQPIGMGELVGGKLLGTGTWAIVLLTLFTGPVVVRAGMLETMLPLVALSVGFLLVCMLAGLGIGLVAAPVSGLLAVLLTWAIVVAGWELGLLVLSEAAWIEPVPWLFVALLLVNPAGVFRIGALIGVESVPFDTDGLETGQWVFSHIMLVAMSMFAVWAAFLFAIFRRWAGRQEF